MSQLNAASQPIKSHVAVRAESGTLVVVNHIRSKMLYPKEAQRGAWMVCMHLSVWACGFCVLLCYRNLCVLGVLRSDLTGILCRQWRRLNLGICEISLKGGNIPRLLQLSSFTHSHCCYRKKWFDVS